MSQLLGALGAEIKKSQPSTKKLKQIYAKYEESQSALAVQDPVAKPQVVEAQKQTMPQATQSDYSDSYDDEYNDEYGDNGFYQEKPAYSTPVAQPQTVQPQQQVVRKEKQNTHTGLNVMLYIGSLFIIAGIGSLITAVSTSDIVKVVVLSGIVTIFYVGGLIIRRHEIIAPAGNTFCRDGLGRITFCLVCF